MDRRPSRRTVMTGTAAAAAVALKAVVAWVPALALGGSSLVHHRRSVVAAA